jgi:NAD(P)-dependent dehydrogenase (short-subunit alcohol dehydrogenase family)
MDLTGKVAVVTGGANGIGRACALAFARAGAGVVLADLDEAALADATAAVEALGRRALAVRCDVTKDEDTAGLAASTLAAFGRADLVMLNAGVAAGGRWEHIPIAEWQRVLDVNVLGVVRGLNAFLPHLLERGSGHVVITSSGIGLDVRDGMMGPYATSKFALTGMARTLALYLRPHGIGVTLLAPRLTDTAFPRSVVAWGRRGPRTAAERARSGSGFLAPDFADADTPEQVAELLLAGLREDRFLVSADPDIAQRMAAFANDPEGEIRRLSGEG